jgi:NADH:ubiquinone oxidoreductase subunit C
MLENLQINFIKHLQYILKKYIRKIKIKNLYYEIKTNKEYICLLLLFLKFHFITQVESLIDIIVIDKPKKIKRFSIVYNLLSFNYNTRFFIRTEITELSKILSITSIYSAAN